MHEYAYVHQLSSLKFSAQTQHSNGLQRAIPVLPRPEPHGWRCRQGLTYLGISQAWRPRVGHLPLHERRNDCPRWPGLPDARGWLNNKTGPEGWRHSSLRSDHSFQTRDLRDNCGAEQGGAVWRRQCHHVSVSCFGTQRDPPSHTYEFKWAHTRGYCESGRGSTRPIPGRGGQPCLHLGWLQLSQAGLQEPSPSHKSRWGVQIHHSPHSSRPDGATAADDRSREEPGGIQLRKRTWHARRIPAASLYAGHRNCRRSSALHHGGPATWGPCPGVGERWQAWGESGADVQGDAGTAQGWRRI